MTRRAQGCPEPEFDVNGFFTATFRPNPAVKEGAKGYSGEQTTPQETPETMEENVDTPQEILEKPNRVTKEVQLLQAISSEMTRKDIQIALGLKDVEHFRKTYLLPAIQAGLIEMAFPDNPRHRNQRYRLTKKGQEVLKIHREN